MLILGQKWSENDVMAEKRKQSESTESLDEGAFHLNFISWMCVRDFRACMWMFCFFCKQCHVLHFHKILSCKIRLQWAAVLFCLFVFLCNVVFVFLVIISLLEVMQILTSNSKYLLNSQTLTCLKVLLSLKKHMYINVYEYTGILTIWNIAIGIDIIRSKWESSENESSLFSGELPSKGLFLGPYLTMRCL